MRALFGIAAMQRVIASPMQAARSSAVGLLTLASAAVGSTLSNKPTAPNIPVRVLIITISLGRALRAIDADEEFVPFRPGKAVMAITALRFAPQAVNKSHAAWQKAKETRLKRLLISPCGVDL